MTSLSGSLQSAERDHLGRIKSGGKGPPRGAKKKRTYLNEMLGEESINDAIEIIKSYLRDKDKEVALFVLNKCFATPGVSNYMDDSIKFGRLESIGDLRVAYSTVMDAVAKGNISLEHGKALQDQLDCMRKFIFENRVEIAMKVASEEDDNIKKLMEYTE